MAQEQRPIAPEGTALGLQPGARAVGTEPPPQRPLAARVFPLPRKVRSLVAVGELTPTTTTRLKPQSLGADIRPGGVLSEHFGELFHSALAITTCRKPCHCVPLTVEMRPGQAKSLASDKAGSNPARAQSQLLCPQRARPLRVPQAGPYSNAVTDPVGLVRSESPR